MRNAPASSNPQLSERLRSHAGDFEEDGYTDTMAVADIKKAADEIERLRAALTFYADPKVYIDDSIPDRFAIQTWPVMRDAGNRARNALAEVSQPNETTGEQR